MQSPFSSKKPQTSGSVTVCSRHPRSWVEKKVFFVTKTRVCPYCELESYALPDPNNPESSLPPPEPGFGGFAPPEPPTRLTARQRHHRRPSGSGTPQERTPRSGNSMATPRTTVVRRTAVFKPTQSPSGDLLFGQGKPRLPGGAVPPRTRPQGGPSPRTHAYATQSQDGKGTPRARPPLPSSHRRSRSGRSSGSVSSLVPNHIRTVEAENPASSGSTPRGAGDAPSPRPPSAATINASPNLATKSLRFTSAARKGGGSSHTPKAGSGITIAGAGSEQSSPQGVHDAPPSSSGSTFSGLSSVGGSVKGIEAEPPRRTSGSGFSNGQAVPTAGPGGLTLSVPSPANGRRAGKVSVVPPSSTESELHVVKEESSSTEASTATASVDVSENLNSTKKAAGQGAGGRSHSMARAVAESVLAAAKAAVPTVRDQVKPAAAATVSLATALEALRPESVCAAAKGSPESVVLWASGVASSAAKDAEALWREEEEGGSSAPGQDAEAAGAILAEAGHAVEKLAQIARAFAWGGNASHVGKSATFAERHQQASAAVLEAAVRTESLLAVRLAAGKPPRDAAPAQRQWLAVLDHHEAWTRRSASKAGLLEAEQEIPAGSVAIFKDCEVLGEGVFGPTFAAEYLGVPVSVSILDESSADASADAVSRLRTTATEELRTLAARVPPHPRLARTHGTEMISASVPLNIVHSGFDRKDEAVRRAHDGNSESMDESAASSPALVVVGDLVEGGSLRKRAAVAEQPGAAAGATGTVFGMMIGLLGQRLQPRQILADVAAGLAYLHGKGVTHGALSSENVLLDAAGRAKLSLFGLTKTRIAAAAYVAVDDTRASPAVMCPTPWTPPEALRQTPPIPAAADAGAGGMGKEGVRNPVGAADAYALGIIAWEILTGQQPWEGLSVDEMSERVLRGDRPILPAEAATPAILDGFEGFSDLLAQLWAQDPEARPALRDVARALSIPMEEPVYAEPYIPPTADDDVEAMGPDIERLPAMDNGVSSDTGDGNALTADEDGQVSGVEKTLALEMALEVDAPAAAREEVTDGTDVSMPEDSGTPVEIENMAHESLQTQVRTETQRGVEGDEAGCPLADGTAGGSATPAGGGGGETLVSPDGDKDADAPSVGHKWSEPETSGIRQAENGLFTTPESPLTQDECSTSHHEASIVSRNNGGGHAQQPPIEASIEQLEGSPREAVAESVDGGIGSDTRSPDPCCSRNGKGSIANVDATDGVCSQQSNMAKDQGADALFGEALVALRPDATDSDSVAAAEQASLSVAVADEGADGAKTAQSEEPLALEESQQAVPTMSGASASDVDAPPAFLETWRPGSFRTDPSEPQIACGGESGSDMDELYFSADEEIESQNVAGCPAASAQIPAMATVPAVTLYSSSLSDIVEGCRDSEREMSNSVKVLDDAAMAVSPEETAAVVDTASAIEPAVTAASAETSQRATAPAFTANREEEHARPSVATAKTEEAKATGMEKGLRLLRHPKKRTPSAFASIRDAQREIEEAEETGRASVKRFGDDAGREVPISSMALRSSSKGSTDNTSSSWSEPEFSRNNDTQPINEDKNTRKASSIPNVSAGEILHGYKSSIDSTALLTPPQRQTTSERRLTAEQRQPEGAAGGGKDAVFSAISMTPRRARLAERFASVRGVASSLIRFGKKKGDPGKGDFGDS